MAFFFMIRKNVANVAANAMILLEITVLDQKKLVLQFNWEVILNDPVLFSQMKISSNKQYNLIITCLTFKAKCFGRK